MQKQFYIISPCAVCDGRRSSPKHFLSKAASHVELASQFAAPSILHEAQQLQIQHGDQQNTYGQIELDADQELRNTDSHSQISQLPFMQE